MTTRPALKVINWKDAAPRDAHGQVARDLYRREEGGFSSSFNYMTVFTLPPGNTSGSHAHDNWEKVYLVLAGNCEAHLDGSVFKLNSGDTFFVHAGVKHEMKNPTSQEAQYAVFCNYTLPVPEGR
ncbi:MAG: cupin domain-containing protein [Chloroflexi bacterium]|nr:cupin domain-containing protein [Chloroflexota bacterium]